MTKTRLRPKSDHWIKASECADTHVLPGVWPSLIQSLRVSRSDAANLQLRVIHIIAVWADF